MHWHIKSRRIVKLFEHSFVPHEKYISFLLYVFSFDINFYCIFVFYILEGIDGFAKTKDRQTTRGTEYA